MTMNERRVHSSSKKNFTNILVVHGLSAPNGQESAFLAEITRIASSIVSWANIVYIDAAKIVSLDKKMIEGGLVSLQDAVCELTGIDDADELYLSREWQTGNRILMSSFEEADKICFGDAIGLYFREDYFVSGPSKKKGITGMISSVRRRAALAKNYPQRRPLLSYYSNEDFDYGYFVYPGISGVLPDFPYSLIDDMVLQEIFGKFAASFNSSLLNEVNWNSAPVTFFLTSNFSEAERMTYDNELKAYKLAVETYSKPGSLLVIKPHPRDDSRKLVNIRKHFAAAGYKVIVMDDLEYFYTPFEFFLIQLRSQYPEVLLNSTIICTSSSCLGIFSVLGIKPVVAFGEENVKRFFEPAQVNNRISHEKDLVRSMSKS